MTCARLLLAAAVALAAAPAAAADAPSRYRSLCPYEGQKQAEIAREMGIGETTVAALVRRYCANVGKQAHSSEGWRIAQKFSVGPIEGVAWVERGTPLSEKPGAGLRAVKTGFYYIVGPSDFSDHRYLRYAPQTNAK